MKNLCLSRYGVKEVFGNTPGGTQSDIHWFQNIGEDPFPVLEESHGIVVEVGDGIYTGIREVQTSDGPTAFGQAIYNLSGQRLSKMQKGINIVNGKKILVK